MTNISLLSVPKGVCLILLAVLVGCGPKDGNREFEQGKQAYEVRDLVKAARLFEESLKCAPHDVDRILLLARVKLDLGELAEAQDLMKRAALDSDGDADVRMLTAQLAWHAKDYKSAAEGFSSLANDMKLEAAIRAQAWAGLGVVEMSCDNCHQARVAFLRAIRLDRRNAAAWYHLGLLYRDEFGYLEAALEQFEIFARLEEMASPRVQKVQRAVIPALKDTMAHAISERPGAAKRNSALCSTTLAKAEAEWKKGQYGNARQSYQAALTADLLSYPAAVGLARAWEVTDRTSAGQAKAFENYKLACTLKPSAVSTFVTAGNLAARLGYHSQAVEIFSRAVAASPTSFDALDGLIRSLRKVNKPQDARAYQQYRESIPTRRK